MKTDLQFKRVIVPAGAKEVRLDLTGGFFRCTKAGGVFEMNYDENGWFEWQRGLKFRLAPDSRFKSLAFRSLATTTVDDTLEFYYGSADVDDSRLSVIGENESTVSVRPVDRVVDMNNSGQTDLAVGSQIVLTGRPIYFDGFKNVQLRRNHLLITNLHSTRVLDINAMQGGIFNCACFPLSTIRLEGSDTITIDNNSSGTVRVRYYQVIDRPE